VIGPRSRSGKATGVPEIKFVTLRCPGCLAQVNVGAGSDLARCSMCGTAWKWKKGAPVTLVDSRFINAGGLS